jgi:Transposase DDE domain group 1
LPEEVVEFYEKRGNCETYIKEAKYDMTVGHLLLQSFWANEAIFQIMMLTYNLFLLCKKDFEKGNGIPAANQNLPVEVHFPGRKDHPNGQKRGDETFREISLSRDV